jgi:hypothetical protein
MNEWLGLVCYLVVVGLSLRRYYGLRRRTRRIRIGGGVMTLDRPISRDEAARLKDEWLAARHDRPTVLP